MAVRLEDQLSQIQNGGTSIPTRREWDFAVPATPDGDDQWYRGDESLGLQFPAVVSTHIHTTTFRSLGE